MTAKELGLGQNDKMVRRLEMKEQDYQKKIVKRLEAKGAYVVKVVSASKKGVPDVLACVPMNKEQIMKLLEKQGIIGVFYGIEVKTPTTRSNVSPLQEYNLAKIDIAGGIACVAVDFEDIPLEEQK